LAHVLEGDGELVAHLISYHPADADAARFRQAFKARCDVDPVAEDVVGIDDDVAEIDADAEIDAPFGVHTGIARGHLALHFDRATNRIDHARELAEQTVARLLTMRPRCSLILGSATSRRSVFSAASVPSSSAPIRRE